MVDKKNSQNPYNEYVGQSIRQLREEHGWTLNELAERISKIDGFEKYNAMSVSRTEKGTRSISLQEASAYADVFDLPLQRFVPNSLDSETIKALRKVTSTWKEFTEAGENAIDSIANLIIKRDELMCALSHREIDGKHLSAQELETFDIWTCLKFAVQQVCIHNLQEENISLADLDKEDLRFSDEQIEEATGVKKSTKYRPDSTAYWFRENLPADPN